MIELPEILNIPKKLIPMIIRFNDFRRFLLTGGRGGGKTQSVARMLLWIGDTNKVRIVCGRELQSSISESVYTTFCDLIAEYDLNYKVYANKIENLRTGSVINFKGFRDQGRANIKGLEGVDILWIDEAETITKETLDTVIPTIRKDNSKLIFTMNRKSRFDPVFIDNDGRDDCLSIKINYVDNPYCSKELINEAMQCKERSESDYNHVWLGEPKPIGDLTIFNSLDLDKCKDVEFYGSNVTKGRVLAVDVANGGGDLTVAGCIDWLSPNRFNNSLVCTWDVKNLMETVGRIVDLKHKYNPDIIVVDATGVGEGVFSRLLELGLPVIDFKSARSSTNVEAYNTRAEAFIKTREKIEKNELRITDRRVLSDLEVMTYKQRSDNKKQITSKSDIKKIIQRSPDFADMLVMGVWGLDKLTFKNTLDNLQYSYNII